MTIETKIAKNGSKRYYVRDENGKCKQISAAVACEIERRNKFAALEQKTRDYINGIFDEYEAANGVQHTDDEKAFRAILTATIDGYNCYGQSRCYATIDEAVNAVLFFNKNYYHFNNAAKVDAKITRFEYTTYLTLGYNGNMTFGEEYFALKADEAAIDYAVSTEAQEVATETEVTNAAKAAEIEAADNTIKENSKVELPHGEITATAAEAAELLRAYFPNGVAFDKVTTGFNHEDVFSFTNDRKLFATFTCTPDNRRMDVVEVINTDGTNSKERRPLVICIKPAAVNGLDEKVFTESGKTVCIIRVGNDRVVIEDGKVQLIDSGDYKAHFDYRTNKYVAAILDENGNFKPKAFDTEDEFFAEMATRGACTIDPDDTPNGTPAENELRDVETELTVEDNSAVKVTTKNDKKGNVLFYVDGKRTSRDNAIAISDDNDQNIIVTLSELPINKDSWKNAPARLTCRIYNEIDATFSRQFVMYFSTAETAIDAIKKLHATAHAEPELDGSKEDNDFTEDDIADDDDDRNLLDEEAAAVKVTPVKRAHKANHAKPNKYHYGTIDYDPEEIAALFSIDSLTGKPQGSEYDDNKLYYEYNYSYGINDDIKGGCHTLQEAAQYVESLLALEEEPWTIKGLGGNVICKGTTLADLNAYFGTDDEGDSLNNPDAPENNDNFIDDYDPDEAERIRRGIFDPAELFDAYGNVVAF